MIAYIQNIFKLIRPHQYVKNLFIFLPIFFIGELTNLELLQNAFLAFIAFSVSASAIYILNDFLDVEEDRLHPKKRHRPLAAGLISKNAAFLLIGVLSSIGIILMSTQSLEALGILLTYMLMNLGYCFFLKHIPIVDITIISIGFILRLFIGSFVTGIPLSKWIVIMTFLLALFLALAKRRDDVILFDKTGNKMRKVIHGYNVQFIDGAMMIMAAVMIVSYILYTTSIEVVQRIQNEYIYLTSFFVILGVLRYLQVSFVELNAGSPSKVILKDKFIFIVVLAWIFSFVLILYV